MQQQVLSSALLAFLFLSYGIAEIINIGDCPSFAAKSYDYIVVGGGNAGLVVANRLSANSSVSVGVIEAGPYFYNDSLIDAPALIGMAQMNSSYAWLFNTIPQKDALNVTVPWPRGKMVGGSSGLNYMAWTRPQKDDLDNWSKLYPGSGWDDASLLEYSKRSENTSQPNMLAKKHNATLTRRFRGFDGPIHVSWPKSYVGFQKYLSPSYLLSGSPFQREAADGTNEGHSLTPSSVNPTNSTRSYAASAYFAPFSYRKNLHLITNAQVNNIMLSKHSSNGLQHANGVNFTDLATNKTYTVKAKKQVILSAGAIQSPQLLELSGIGNRKRLEELGISVKVENNHVGENLQDHLYLSQVFQTKDLGFTTTNNLSDPVTYASAAQQYYTNATGLFTLGSSLLSFLSAATFMNESSYNMFKTSIDEASWYQNATTPYKEQFQLYRKAYEDEKRISQVEVILLPGAMGDLPSKNHTYATLAYALVHPFSRGSIHINSSNPLTAPLIDPRYLHRKPDLDTMAAALTWGRNVASNVKPFSDYIVQETSPGSQVVEADLANWIKQNVGTEYHPIGTCAMLPKSKGGVVDSSLRVYGTNNLRVVDASVFPLHVSSHIQVSGLDLLLLFLLYTDSSFFLLLTYTEHRIRRG